MQKSYYTALQQLNKGVLQQLIPELPQHDELKQTGQISQWQPVVGSLVEQKNLTIHFCRKIPASNGESKNPKLNLGRRRKADRYLPTRTTTT